MTFANPDALLLLAGLPLLWLIAWRYRRLHVLHRLTVATLVRSLIVLALIVAMAQPEVLRRSREKSVVYAIDVSRSVSSSFVAEALRWAAAANERYRPVRTRFLVFGDGVRMLDSAEQVLSVAVTVEDKAHTSPDSGAIGQSATDIEAALQAAMFGFAPYHAKRLVLISDGNQTRGDVWRALPRLTAEGVRVFTLPATTSADIDAWVESIAFPAGVRKQEPVRVRVTVRSLASVDSVVELASRKSILGKRTVVLQPGENVIAFETRLSRAGNNILTARVRADGDQVAENDAISDSVWVGPRPRVLYVEGMPESARYLSEALQAHYIDVTIVTAQALNEDVGILDGHDAVVLSDVYAHDIEPLTAQSLDAFVRERGGGLVFAAGESTYGKQGYSNSEIERLLPVRFEGKRKRRELDLVLLIDRSHSMRGRKLELAKTAALSTLDLLEEQHRLSVVGFDSRANIVVPLAEVGNKRRAEDLIASMTASGQTDIYPALAMARRMLADSSASTKHVILLSDGVTAPLPGSAVKTEADRIHAEIQDGRAEEMRRTGDASPSDSIPKLTSDVGTIEGLVAALAEEKVSLSTVAIGAKPNLDLMSAIAELADGKSYVAKSDAEMPGLFVSETRRLLGESIVEEPFRPSVGSRGESLAGLDFESGPPLRGFVMTRAKQFSDVLLRAPKEQPLLATTHYGLGKTAAFLSDVKNRWSAEWLEWDGYGRLWSQVVRDVIPRSSRVGLTWRVSREENVAVVELTALASDHSYRNSLLPRVRVTSPDGQTSMLMLRQIAPGEYLARMPIGAGQAMPYRFEMLEGGGVEKTEIAQAGVRTLSYTWTDEYRALPPNNELLRALSEQTGGMFAPRAQDVFADYGDGGLAPQALWHWFVSAALLLFLVDILVRRAPWSIGDRMFTFFARLRRTEPAGGSPRRAQ
jgi:Ca-activated chloride channel family protein